MLPEVGVLPFDFSETLAAALESSSPKTLLTAVEYFPLFCANLLFIDCNGDGARIGDAVDVVVALAAAAVVVVGVSTLAGDGDRDRVLFDFILLGDGEDARETRCWFILDGDGDSGGVLGGDADTRLLTNNGVASVLLLSCCCFRGELLSIVV